MKAAIVKGAGQAPVHGDFPRPDVGPGERRIRVAAAALSPLTRSRAAGTHYSASNAYPFVAGVDGVGRLDDGGRVYFVLPRPPYGAMAEETVASAARCIPLPDDLDDMTAAALANPGMSSWVAFRERAKLTPGETVLVNGATGAAGRLAVRIARHLGAGRVIATGRNRAALEAVGADETIPLVADARALEEAFRKPFARGVDVVIDYLWGESAETMLVAAARAHEGEKPIRFVQVGSISGPDIRLMSAALRAAPIVLMGSGVGGVGLDRLIAAISDLFGAVGPAGLAIETKAVPLADVESAWSAEEGGARLVFTP